MDATNSRVTLVRGTRYVTIRPGSKWVDDNGRRIPLLQPTYTERGRLIASLRPLATAVGATVAFDPTTRATDVNFAFLSFLPKPRPQQHSPFTAIPQGFAPPELSEYDPGVLAGLRKEGYAHPWACLGDFNGDGFEDIALLVHRKSSTTTDESGVILLPGDAFGWQRFSWLAGAPPEVHHAPGELLAVLRTHPPGEVAYYQEGESTPKSGWLQLKHDAIEVMAWEKAASLHYWDEEAKRYNSVISSD
jgi:hypothetical protein